MSQGRKQDMKKIREQLVAQGFIVEVVPNGHWKVKHAATGESIQISSTPRYARAILNNVTRLKRIGFEPVQKKQKKKTQS